MLLLSPENYNKIVMNECPGLTLFNYGLILVLSLVKLNPTKRNKISREIENIIVNESEIISIY